MIKHKRNLDILAPQRYSRKTWKWYSQSWKERRGSHCPLTIQMTKSFKLESWISYAQWP